jgi:lipoate-protein ligase B
MAKVITYNCDVCGSEIVVTESGLSELSHIYCCGIEVTEVSSVPKKQAKKPTKAAKKVVKKKVAKKTAASKKR